MNKKRPAAVLLAAVLAAAGLPANAEARPTQSAGPLKTITLITGDRVTLGTTGRATVRAAKGREGIGFAQRIDVNGDVYVTPLDAERAVRSGQLDPRLFNVTKLIENGFDDRSRDDIPLIVNYQGARRSSAAEVVRELPSIGGTAVRVDKSSAFWPAGFRSAGIGRIWLDGPVRATLDKSVPQIGAPAAWQQGLTGKDTEVAVLDTGIDDTHPDLVGSVVDAKDFTESESGTADKFGHGTHVASIVTGDNDTYDGVAPDTKLLNGKVLGDEGGGYESGIIAGMEWAAGAGAEVVNMSLGSSFPSNGTDIMSQAVNRLTDQTGTLFVISAGNSGGAPGSPGAADAALTVGAVDRNDALAEFSSRGPRWEDDAIKPDITAPGVGIVAAKAKDSYLGSVAPNVGEHHLRLSGTSMAAPHVAGAAAILAGQHPDWSATDLKAALMGSAKANPALSVFEQGAGRVDVAKAVSSSVRAVPGSLSVGIVQWPHNDDKPIDKPVTYHNTGTAPVTLTLTADVRDPSGRPAPAGMFSVTPGTLTIPAGGKASATVTTNTAVNGQDGIYSGSILAGGIRTPIAVTREVESYDVKLTFRDFEGNPTPNYFFRFVDIDHPKAYLPYDESGTVTARLPKGRFFFEASVSTDEEFRYMTAVEPQYVVTGPAAMTVDAREGKPIGFVTDKPNAAPGQAVAAFLRDTTWGGEASTGALYFMNNFDGFLVRPSTTASAPADFDYTTEARMAEPDGEGGFSTSSYLYNLRKTVPGRVPETLIARVRDSELARARSEHVATKPGRLGSREGTVTRPLPFSLDEFYTPDEPWYGQFEELNAPGEFPVSLIVSASPRTFRLGHKTKERWNAAVFGPALPKPYRPWDYAGRLGDEVAFSIPLYTDQVIDREGYSQDSGSTTLFRDGVEIGKSKYAGYGEFTVPAGAATYRLHTEAVRDDPLTSKITADWTFTSDTVAGDTPAALPLLAVRFAPRVDDHNRVSAAVPTLVPIAVDHNTRGSGRVTKLQVSHDEGATWRTAPLITVNGKTFTVIQHPKGAASVSLKASASDGAGNTVDQTIIKAFALK